jgi:histidinol phosphatase-like enzyme (inositol monophosphatase family)
VPADELDEFTRFAERLADTSREILRSASAQRPCAEVKDDASPVTALDRAVEDRLRDAIAREYPDHGIVGEERGVARPESDQVWVLDPIDGTLAFLAGIPVFGTLIALLREGVPAIGVIDMPATGDRWVGCAGRPTTWNGEAVHARPCAELSTALLSTSNPDFYGAAEFEAFERLKSAVRWTVYGGSCLAYARIASGRIDLGIDAGLDPVDYCALVPVIRGAGGAITDWEGADLGLRSGSRILAAGDPRAHALALEILAQT